MMDMVMAIMAQIINAKVSEMGIYMALGSISGLCIFLLIYVFLKKRRLKDSERKYKMIESLVNMLQPSKTLDSVFSDILYSISMLVEAPSYGSYLVNEKSNSLVLKSVRQRAQDHPQMSPSYSGLLAGTKDMFFMPASLSLGVMPDKTELYKKGDVPLVLIPLKNSNGMIVIGPINRISKKLMEILDDYGEKIQPIVNMMMNAERMRVELEGVGTSGRGVKNGSNILTDLKENLDGMMEISLKTMNAKGGVFITSNENSLRLETIIGMDEGTKDLIRRDEQILSLFSQFIGCNKFISLTKKDSDFFRIPPYFIAEGAELLLLLNMGTPKAKGIVVLWYDGNPNIKEYQVAAFQIMANRMGDIISCHRKFEECSSFYGESLNMLAKLVDDVKPTTVGYSDLMYRYGWIIANEMNLSSDEAKSIATAASLSNIGMIGISDEILFKKGKYTEAEYERMKVHADAGATMIEATMGNQEMASYIRYHHERVDGDGYNTGLAAEEIPLGARVIAVIQIFLEMILGRQDREALPFKEALDQLKGASGTQLDSNVVDALLNWFERKENIHRNGALGNCWEMRCSPENICTECDAYLCKQNHCWEVEENNCKAHGNECDTCFVRTEYLYRVNKK